MYLLCKHYKPFYLTQLKYWYCFLQCFTMLNHHNLLTLSSLKVPDRPLVSITGLCSTPFNKVKEATINIIMKPMDLNCYDHDAIWRRNFKSKSDVAFHRRKYLPLCYLHQTVNFFHFLILYFSRIFD